jgi:hypothetical protein
MWASNAARRSLDVVAAGEAFAFTIQKCAKIALLQALAKTVMSKAKKRFFGEMRPTCPPWGSSFVVPLNRMLWQTGRMELKDQQTEPHPRT